MKFRLSRLSLLWFLPLLLALTGCDEEVRLGQPSALWLLWLLPLIAAFFVYSARKKSKLLEQFASAELLERLTTRVSVSRQVLKSLLILVALGLLLFALAEPKWGYTWEDVRRRGVDVIIALDVSDSMLVQDAQAQGDLTRLERARREIQDLLNMLDGDRIGLVAFAGTAFLECPLTLDYSAAQVFLEAIDTDLIPVKGTNLAEALEVSQQAFEASGSNESRAIILITDGEDHEGRAQEVADSLAAAGIRVFPIGIGRDEGSPIPRPGGGFRRDRSGEIILSKLDEPALQSLAVKTGGRYVRSVSGDMDLEQIYLQGIKATLEDQELTSRRQKRWEERFQWPLGLGLFLLMLEPLISERRRRFAEQRASSENP